MTKARRLFGISWRVTGALFGLFMVFMVLKGLHLFHGDVQDFDKKSHRAVGVVEEIRQRYVPDLGYRNDYIIRFTTREGESVTYRERPATDPGLREGQRVRVRYMPENPTYAKLDTSSGGGDTVYYVMLLVIALGFLTSSVVLFVSLSRFLKRNPA